MEIEIRSATADDAETIVAIYRSSKLASLPELVESYDHDVTFLTNRWRSYIADGSRAQMSKGDGFVFIAYAEQTPVGYAAYHHTARHSVDAELQSLYVLPDAQGTGVGTALVHLIVARLVDEGSKSMCVGYDPRNPYRRFYWKHGAVEINPHWAIWGDVRSCLPPKE